MRKYLSRIQRRSISTHIALAFVAIFAATFWVSTSSGGDPVSCDVCHKRTTTLSFPCNSLDYRRHLDHGDAMGACSVTPTENP